MDSMKWFGMIASRNKYHYQEDSNDMQDFSTLKNHVSRYQSTVAMGVSQNIHKQYHISQKSSTQLSHSISHPSQDNRINK